MLSLSKLAIFLVLYGSVLVVESNSASNKNVVDQAILSVYHCLNAPRPPR